MTLTAFRVHILDYSARDYGVYFKYEKSDNVINSFIIDFRLQLLRILV